MKPTIGRIVIYRSRTGEYSCPAIITATSDTLHRPNVEAGHIADLDSDTHVHLFVMTPGLPGHVSDSTRENHPEVIRDPAPSGYYQESNIPQNATQLEDMRAQEPGLVGLAAEGLMGAPDPRLTQVLKEALLDVFRNLKAGQGLDDVDVAERLAAAAQDWFEAEHPEVAGG